ncbi:MAG: hypothetical protein K0R21_1235 [Anaerocolumna sp.]|jgi:N-acetylglutamate synthase-like GNAT family acetyltransferase|nr:hypothetical protein [Anaerocolumna sp.]
MERYIEYLKKYRDTEISKAVLEEVLNGAKAVSLVEVYAINLIDVLNKYSAKEIDDVFLLEWVNTIWFSEWYFYNEDQCDSIASVMNVLEELDEGELVLNQEKIEMLVNALKNNSEI